MTDWTGLALMRSNTVGAFCHTVLLASWTHKRVFHTSMRLVSHFRAFAVVVALLPALASGQQLGRSNSTSSQRRSRCILTRCCHRC
jgi:hypothetical protein